MRLDFLKKITKNEIVAFSIIGCFIVFILYYFLFLSPVISKFLSVFHDVSKAQSKLYSTEVSIDGVPKVRKEIEELKSKASFYSSKLPREEEFPEILESLSNMAQNAGVKITKILPIKGFSTSAEENVHAGIYEQKEISINAQCGYHELGAFIAELENAARFMEVSDIRIEAMRTNPKQHNVQLIVKTFILKIKGEY